MRTRCEDGAQYLQPLIYACQVKATTWQPCAQFFLMRDEAGMRTLIWSRATKLIYLQVAPNAKYGDLFWWQSAILVMMMCTKLACSAGLLNDTYGLRTSPKRKTTSADVSSATAMVFPHNFVRLEARSSGVAMSWSRDIRASSSSRVMSAVLVQHSSLTTVKTSHCGLWLEGVGVTIVVR